MLFQRFQNPSSFCAGKSDGCLFPPFYPPLPHSRSIRRMGPSALQTLSHLVCKVVLIRVVLKHVWKFGWKGCWENARTVKRWFFWLYLEWSLCTLRTCKVCCTLTPTAVFIATFNWLGSTIYAARRITWTDEVLQCATLKQACTVESQHNSASWYWSSDLDLCSSGKNVTPDRESKSFAIPSLGISCLHFLSFPFLKMLFLIPQQPCLSVSNIREVPISSSYRNGISHPVLTVQLAENGFDVNASEPRRIR